MPDEHGERAGDEAKNLLTGPGQMGGIARFDARQTVRPTIDEILDRWESGTIEP